MTRTRAHRTVRARPRVAGTAAALGCVLALTAARCDGSADQADASLKQLATVTVLSTPPTGGALLGQGKDRGSNSSVTGREPGITSVFTTSMSVADAKAYYQRSYPAYRFSEDCCTTPSQVQLSGRQQFPRMLASIGVTITTSAPEIPQHYHIKVKPAAPGTHTYVVVLVSGQQQ